MTVNNELEQMRIEIIMIFYSNFLSLRAETRGIASLRITGLRAEIELRFLVYPGVCDHGYMNLYGQ
jgi:hypothetical protein